MSNLLLRQAFALAILFLLCITSCKNSGNDKKNETANSPGINTGTGRFDIAAPEGWTKTDTVAMGMQTILLLSPLEDVNDNFRENVNVVTEKVGTMSLEKYVDLSKEGLAQMLNNYSERGSGKTTISGEPAEWIDYSHSMNMYEIDGRAYLMIKDGIAYIITATAMRGMQNKWQSVFEEAINSFRLK